MRFSALFAASCCCGLLMYGGPPDTSARVAWDEMIAAKGGATRLEGILNMEQVQAEHLFSVKAGLRDTDTLTVKLFVFPDKYWQWFDGGSTRFGLSLNVWNLETGVSWLAYGNGPAPRRLTGDEPGDRQIWEAQLVWLNQTAWLHPDPVRFTAGRGHQPDIIETRVSHKDIYRVDFLVDRRTHLPVKILEYETSRQPFGPRTHLTEWTLRRYSNISGVMVPTSVTNVIDPGRTDDVHTDFSCDIALNVAVKPETFSRPPSIKEGAYAWQQK